MKNKLKHYAGLFMIGISLFACSVPKVSQKQPAQNLPEQYAAESADSINSVSQSWKNFFTDPYLQNLIDSALENNQELNIMMQRINRAQNEIKSRKGEYLPFVGIGAGAGVDKVGRYTRNGALEATTDIKPGEEFPEPLPDFMVGAYASWEIDVWSKLHNAKKAAVAEYLASVEGRNFMVTQLVAEIASSYYELLAYDNQLDIIQQNIEILNRALQIVKLQKQAAKVTELAVRKFEAELYKNQSLQYYLQQNIVELENRINFLVGRYPQTIQRSVVQFTELEPNRIVAGLPAQLLENRPDIKQAELELSASKLDVKVAKAAFYPSLELKAGAGFQAFDAQYWFRSPESMLYSVAGELMAPLINRNVIKAQYKSANARQIEKVYEFEQTLLRAYVEVVNQLSKVDNLSKSYEMQSKQVDALNRSIKISTGLFKSARADYMEVLMTQRDALESKMELIETKQKQMNAMVKTYQALGGGWQ